MRQINVYDRGDRVAIEYEVDSLIFKRVKWARTQ